MEIHRRPRQQQPPSAESATDEPQANGRARASSTPRRPAPTAADPLLLRPTRFVVLAGLFWFLRLVAPANRVVSNGSGVRGSPSRDERRRRAVASDSSSIASARERIDSVRSEFYDRYGGKDESLAMLRRGLKTFSKTDRSGSDDGAFSPDSLRGTAHRILNALIRRERRSAAAAATAPAEFVLSFGGYSVTVGRGNRFSQSFPFVLQSVASPLFSSLGVRLEVRNGAIGGIPSFPYGWCLPNFLGSDSHGISWDYGMNEGNGGLGLEGYLRQGIASAENGPPLFIMVDAKKPRMQVLQYYVDQGILVDPLALGGKEAVKKELLEMPEPKRPPGLQKWDEWGAPKGAPGQSAWHPKKMEHELMGWMLAMYFVESVEVALGIMEEDVRWREKVHEQLDAKSERLPPPMTDASKTGVSSLLHGVPSENGWRMHKTSCRTSFLPNISGRLESIVVSGMTVDDEDMIESRDDSLFDGGWVMDVGKVERETKVKVNKYGGLGYIDMKTALYGIPSSGTLKLWLPYEGETKPSDTTNDAPAAKFFKSVVLCEVNEKRGDRECKMSSDLAIGVGGASVSKGGVRQISQVASYLKKDICIQVGIPEAAAISFKEGEFGLDVEVTVVNSGVTRERGACSISHVIWEHQ